MLARAFVFCLFAIATFAVAARAELAGGGWFNPLGNLEFSALGASEWEAALQNRGTASLALQSGAGAKWKENGESFASSTESDMNLRFLLAAPMSTLVGLSLESPWPEREVALGGDTLWRESDPTRFALLLGMRPVKQILAYGEIPIAAETGVWRAGVELFPWDGARLRFRYTQQKTIDKIVSWNLGTTQKFSQTERQGEAQAAFKLPLHLQVAAALRYSRLSGDFADKVWGTGGELVYLKKNWSLKTKFDANWRENYDTYLASSRLQRTFWNLLRVGLEAEETLALQNPDDAWISQKSYGGDLRFWWQGLFLQGGGFWVRSEGAGQTLAALGFGRRIAMQDLFAHHAIEMRLEVGFEVNGTLYRYSYDKTFPLWRAKPVVNPNTTHRFEIGGNF
jgi:hypothetical protein